MITGLTGSHNGTKLESLFGEVGQDGLSISQSNAMTELMSPSLTGAKTECLFGEVGHILKCCGSQALLGVPNDGYVWRWLYPWLLFKDLSC